MTSGPHSLPRLYEVTLPGGHSRVGAQYETGKRRMKRRQPVG